jgi:chromodomain-helicase-DNA-binding protein 4
MIDFDDTPIKAKKSRKSKSKSVVSEEESDAYTGGSGFGASDGEDTDDNMPLTADDRLALADRSTAKNGTPKETNVKSFVPDNIARNTNTRYRDVVPLSPIDNTQRNETDVDNPVCSLCGIRHGNGACYMTESSENLAEYRQMLILHADDEPMEDRVRIWICYDIS